jgi:hypothetical protein
VTRRLPAVTVLLIFLAATPAAVAETPPLPEEFSAADQYVESVPTSSGPKPAKKEKRKEGDARAVPVPAAVEELHGMLKEVATSPSLGAPERSLPDARAESPSVPSATVSAIDEADGGRVGWLLVALLVVSGATAGTALYRHRARTRQTDA